MGRDYHEGCLWMYVPSETAKLLKILKRRYADDTIAVTSRKRVLVLVNPVGGKGNARSIVKDTVIPILEAADCVFTMMGM